MTTLLTPAELREGRMARDLSCPEFARLLLLGDGGERTVRRWESGQHPIPGSVQVLLGYLWKGILPSGLCPGATLAAPVPPRRRAAPKQSRR